MRSFRIGSLFGIPIKLDLTFLLILPVYAYLIGSRIAETADALNMVLPGGVAAIDPAALSGGGLEWAVGFVAAVGLFVGVVLHELGHSLTARYFGYPIDSITLWLFGGVASLSEMPEDWKREFLIAIAGPIVSVAIGVVCWVALFALPGLDVALFVVGYLALLNVVLAAFNMLPGFPMDGGRVLRALLSIRYPYARATKYAAEVGKAFAILLGLFGVFTFQLIPIGLAFFIYIGASSEAQQTMMKAAFEGVTVGDVMTPLTDLDTIQSAATVSELIGRMIRERHTGFPVMDGDRFVGIATLDDARQVRQAERDAFEVGEVMTDSLTTVTPETDAMTAITLMQENGVGRLPVVDDGGRLVGLISRSDLMTALEIIRSSQSLKPHEGLGRPGTPGARADPEGDTFRPGK